MRIFIAFILLLHANTALGREYHVSVEGRDDGSGSRRSPFRTIAAAARRAEAGDVITVHAGIYRERVTPPRGGTSARRRIVYRAAPGEKVVITGSEVLQGWEKVQGDTWKVTVPNSFFGGFNPYSDVIHGDGFVPGGQIHHTGAVYLNGMALTEAASHLNEVLQPVGRQPLWFGRVDGARDGEYLLNVASMTVGGRRLGAERFVAKSGELHAAADAAVGQCVGWIRAGSWLKYEPVDFGAGTESVEFLAASVTGGGAIELRLDGPDGALLGTCEVLDTGDWHQWVAFRAKIHPTQGERSVCLVFRARPAATDNTTIWAQFPGVNPNEQLVEINVRPTVFSSSKVGVDFLTVRGFTLRQAATPWVSPAAAQLGLVSASGYGWIIENNEIIHSRCAGVALGPSRMKDDHRANAAEDFAGHGISTRTMGRHRATVGGHIVRRNRISHCEQAGIVGNVGGSFSAMQGNEISDIHVQRRFAGAEIAGIKLHGAVEVAVSHNHIYRTPLAIGLDGMGQRPQIAANLLHDNGQDLVVEERPGPVPSSERTGRPRPAKSVRALKRPALR